MTRIMDARSFLKETGLFRDLGDEELARLCSIAVEETFAKGAVIFKERDAGGKCYVVETGVVEVGRTDELTRKFVRLARLERGESFGEMAFLDERPRAATAVAAIVPETKCLSWECRAFEKLIATDPALGVRVYRGLLRRLCARQRQTDETIHTLWRSLNTV